MLSPPLNDRLKPPSSGRGAKKVLLLGQLCISARSGEAETKLIVEVSVDEAINLSRVISCGF
jgi:hypothetical protein